MNGLSLSLTMRHFIDRRVMSSSMHNRFYQFVFSWWRHFTHFKSIISFPAGLWCCSSCRPSAARGFNKTPGYGFECLGCCAGSRIDIKVHYCNIIILTMFEFHILCQWSALKYFESFPEWTAVWHCVSNFLASYITSYNV